MLKRSGGRTTGLLLAALAAVAFAGTTLPSTPLPRLAIITPITYFVAVLSDIATAIVLLATWRTSPVRRTTIVLALTFAASAVLLFSAMLVLPLLPSAPPVLNASPQSGIWLFMFWHAAIAIGALAYVALRRPGVPPPSRRFTLIATAIAAVFVGVGLTLALAFSDRLPPLAAGATLSALVTTGVGPFVALLLTAAAVFTFRIRAPGAIERAYSFSLIALAVELAILLFGGHRYSLVFYFGRVLVLVGAMLVLVSAVRTLIASRSRLTDVEGTLSRIQSESAQRAGRVRAVWQIASHPERSGPGGFDAMLAIATGALRPGRPVVGALCHLDADLVVVDATAWTGYEAPPSAALKLYPGASVALARTLANRLLDSERSQAWDDGAFEDAPFMFGHELGFRSFIGSPISIGRNTHFVMFYSPESMVNDPYAEDDIAYVDVVSSFFASRFSEQEHQKRAKFQFEHDPLTGLANRMHFRTAVRNEIRGGDPFAIAFIDLDGFRHVNKRDGHHVGDELLVSVATALDSVSPRDTVARMSADEFGVILAGAASRSEATAAIARYAELFLSPFDAGDRMGTHVLRVGASIGAARFPDDGRSPEELMRRADVALDVAKSGGGSTTKIFDEAMESILEESQKRVEELAEAIATNQLALVYQPTFDLGTRAIVGAEALVRWDHPVRGRLAPAEFIEFAERHGLIGPLSLWVFHRVVRDVLTTSRLPPGFRLYFNVAAQMLEDAGFIADVEQSVHHNPVLAKHLGIEVTETAAMQNVERSMNTIDVFRGWGISVAIDDFGTGYSSLSYLKQLTVDMIKIDRAFVTGLPNDKADGAITEMLLRITEQFGFTSLAEGIETEAQLAWLRQRGCRCGQGYLIARPETFGALLERLASQREGLPAIT